MLCHQVLCIFVDLYRVPRLYIVCKHLIIYVSRNHRCTENGVAGSIFHDWSEDLITAPYSGESNYWTVVCGSNQAGLSVLVNGTLRSMGSASPGNIEMMVVGGNVPWSVAEVVF